MWLQVYIIRTFANPNFLQILIKYLKSVSFTDRLEIRVVLFYVTNKAGFPRPCL